jgi:NIMA (never in mitosis gene a)-related kinase
MERYLVGQEIGRGSYGVVYKVTSRVDGKTYVLKKLQTSNVPAKERESQLQEVGLPRQ